MLSSAYRALALSRCRLHRRVTVKRDNTEDNEFDKMFDAYQKQNVGLEWKSLLLSKKASELQPRSETQASQADISDFKVIAKPSETFMIEKHRYTALNKAYPAGKANVINYRGSKLTFVSTNYHVLEFKKLWGILEDVKPDIIVAQVRPDQVLTNFKMNLSDENGEFDEDAYIDQLFRKGKRDLFS